MVAKIINLGLRASEVRLSVAIVKAVDRESAVELVLRQSRHIVAH